MAVGIAGSNETDGFLEEIKGSSAALSFFFRQELKAKSVMEQFKDSLSISECSMEIVENQDWNAKWRETMEPVELTGGFWVSPQWLSPPESRKAWIKIEPKMAFGTGHHETTRLAARELINSREWLKEKRLLDIGTGSGVLCFVAQICGSAFSLGLEIDSECRENLAENRELNSVEGGVEFIIGSLECVKIESLFDTVVMNMLYRESVPLLRNVTELLSDSGELIWSGILLEEKDEIIRLARDFGLKIAAESIENEWWCGKFKRK
ncbi:Ribosomal protein L11 methyltransferase [Chitinispirillum alkaliphilum]|nr:Ribosomal protein L11 methyltransferase [Chitinispirillum alkaliphilum]